MRSVTLSTAALLLLACSPDSPETRIRKAFASAVKAVEEGDAAGAVELLDDGFRGPDGMNKAEARGYLLGWFRQEKVGITVVAQKLEVRGNQAVQVVDLLLTGRAGGALLPQESSRHSLHLRWTFTGKAWRMKEFRTEAA
jgi:hypothetical protein